MSKIQTLFGIDYTYYIGGGSPLRKLTKMGDSREIFFTEQDMMDRALKLKEKCLIGDIELFTTDIHKKDYELSFE